VARASRRGWREFRRPKSRTPFPQSRAFPFAFLRINRTFPQSSSGGRSESGCPCTKNDAAKGLTRAREATRNRRGRAGTHLG
jgi:hypothetical protein